MSDIRPTQMRIIECANPLWTNQKINVYHANGLVYIQDSTDAQFIDWTGNYRYTTDICVTKKHPAWVYFVIGFCCIFFFPLGLFSLFLLMIETEKEEQYQIMKLELDDGYWLTCM